MSIVSEASKLGLALHEVSRLCNVVFARPIFLELFLSLLAEVQGTFLGLAIPAALEQGNTVLFIYAAANLAVAALGFLRGHYLYDVGQKIATGFERVTHYNRRPLDNGTSHL